MTSHTVHIDIGMRIDGDQITGHAGVGVSQPKRFLGWLGLIGALDRLVGDPSSVEGPVPATLRPWARRAGRLVPGTGATNEPVHGGRLTSPQLIEPGWIL